MKVIYSYIDKYLLSQYCSSKLSFIFYDQYEVLIINFQVYVIKKKKISYLIIHKCLKIKVITIRVWLYVYKLWICCLPWFVILKQIYSFMRHNLAYLFKAASLRVCIFFCSNMCSDMIKMRIKTCWHELQNIIFIHTSVT